RIQSSNDVNKHISPIREECSVSTLRMGINLMIENRLFRLQEGNRKTYSIKMSIFKTFFSQN
ncbi:hypothetical protein, partial [Bartonella tribocorum]|uniref:hypothetical protein n=1 Tax=Bartonella tribocorum TaxID=85701 RepID=UPI001ABBAB25